MEWKIKMTRVKMWMLGALAVCMCVTEGVRAQTTGSITGWGEQIVLPQSDLTDLVAVARGGSHSLGLRSDGSIAAWGYNSYG